MATQEQRLKDLAAALAADFKLQRTWVASRGQNLVSNGTGLLLDKTNFSGATADLVEKPIGASAAFRTNAVRSNFQTDELIPINVNAKYEYSLQAKQLVGTGRFYSGFAPYDVDKLIINPSMYMFQVGTQTTLALPLNPGDTTITLTSSANWNNAAGGTNVHLRNIIFWDYTDGAGKTWPIGSYSRHTFQNMYNDGGINGNVITLKTPWVGRAFSAGWPLANGSAGSNYMYFPANAICPSEWTEFKARFGGQFHTNNQLPASTYFPMAATFTKIIFLYNYAVAGEAYTNGVQSFANVSLSDVTGLAAVEALSNPSVDFLADYNAA